jgi:2,3-bisphosphoglycerate-independent phosphoglycerate mutase
LDGFGFNPSKIHNAVAEARTPRLDEYLFRYPNTLLQASGAAAGLPDGQMGNSEVGHMTLGSGSVLRQDLVLIDGAIEDGSFFSNFSFNAVMDRALSRGRPVHLLGLVSDGGVHSHVRHLLALIELCRRRRVHPLVHMITDGRDAPPKSALSHLPPLERALDEAGGAIVTVSGRYYAMDRDRRWDRIERAWRVIVLGKGRRATSARGAIEMAYANKETDEFIQPSVLSGYPGLQDDDVMICFNFRKDRPRQMVAALARLDFDGFDRGASPLAAVTCMMEYDTGLGLPYAFESERPAVTLNRAIGEAGVAQFHCAETEKYAHVTHFFNGGISKAADGEEHFLVPSPKVATYDLKPEMSAPQVADVVVQALSRERYGFVLVNFANGDMVGHTGLRHAVLRAVEALDTQLGRVLDAAVAHGYSVVMTADHGNCELLIDPITDAPHTQHTTNPVLCMIIDQERWRLASHGGLANVAPTVLQLMGLPRPEQMTSDSLLLDVVPAPEAEPSDLNAA